jgi:hypothetical protein
MAAKKKGSNKGKNTKGKSEEKRAKRKKQPSKTKTKAKQSQGTRPITTSKLKKITRNAKKNIPKIDETVRERLLIDDAILRAAPKVEQRKWPREEAQEASNDTGMNARRPTGVTLENPQPAQPTFTTPTTSSTQSSTLEEEVDTSPIPQGGPGIASDITYEKVQGLTQRFIQGQLTQDDYRALWNYQQFFKNEKDFLEEYAKALNPRQRMMLERTENLIAAAPLPPVSYIRQIDMPLQHEYGQRMIEDMTPYSPLKVMIDEFMPGKPEIRRELARSERIGTKNNPYTLDKK